MNDATNVSSESPHPNILEKGMDILCSQHTFKSPYSDYEQTKLYQKVQRIINELIDNTDIVLQTRIEYVVGYITKELSSNNSVETEASRPNNHP